MFRFGDSVYFLNGFGYFSVERHVGAPKVQGVPAYVPIVVTGASPSGGGTELERVNMLTSQRRALFSADGTSKEYLLPEYNLPENPAVTVEINGVDISPAAYMVSYVEGTLPRQTKVVFLQEAPAKGVNNVEISWKAASDSKALISAMRFVEKFNGSTDSRLFFYGDGGNVVYYTEPTLSGELTGAYIPAMNEIAIGDDTSPVTGLMRPFRMTRSRSRTGRSRPGSTSGRCTGASGATAWGRWPMCRTSRAPSAPERSTTGSRRQAITKTNGMPGRSPSRCNLR